MTPIAASILDHLPFLILMLNSFSSSPRVLGSLALRSTLSHTAAFARTRVGSRSGGGWWWTGSATGEGCGYSASGCRWGFDRRHGRATRSNAVHDRLGGLLDDGHRSRNLAEVGREAVLVSEAGDCAPQ